MRNVLKLVPLPLLAALVVACSGSPEPDPSPASQGDAELALEDGTELALHADEATEDKGRRHRGRRRGHRPPPPPTGQACEVAGQTFPDGSGVPSGDSCNSCGCNDGSVICTAVACEPVFCALFVEESDGVCSRFPLDPCKSQDPDCVEPLAPTEP
jgi:hypothetical protein